jgi:hypothetical protein
MNFEPAIGFPLENSIGWFVFARPNQYLAQGLTTYVMQQKGRSEFLMHASDVGFERPAKRSGGDAVMPREQRAKTAGSVPAPP